MIAMFLFSSVIKSIAIIYPYLIFDLPQNGSSVVKLISQYNQNAQHPKQNCLSETFYIFTDILKKPAIHNQKNSGFIVMPKQCKNGFLYV